VRVVLGLNNLASRTMRSSPRPPSREWRARRGPSTRPPPPHPTRSPRAHRSSGRAL